MSDTGHPRGPVLETIFSQRVLNVIISLGTLIISTVLDKGSLGWLPVVINVYMLKFSPISFQAGPYRW